MRLDLELDPWFAISFRSKRRQYCLVRSQTVRGPRQLQHFIADAQLTEYNFNPSRFPLPKRRKNGGTWGSFLSVKDLTKGRQAARYPRLRPCHRHRQVQVWRGSSHIHLQRAKTHFLSLYRSGISSLASTTRKRSSGGFIKT